MWLYFRELRGLELKQNIDCGEKSGASLFGVYFIAGAFNGKI